MKRIKQTIALMSVLVFTASAFAGAEVGQSAPEFTATDIQGKTHKLSDYKGKVVILESYNLDCPYVKNHYKSGAMQDLQKQMTSDGAVWLVVNSTAKDNSSYRSPEKAKQEWQAQKMNATAWLDDNSGTIGKAYGMRTTPHMFVIDTEGKLVYQGAIDDRAATDGDPRKARNYVKEAVAKAKAGEKLENAQTKPYGCGVKYGG